MVQLHKCWVCSLLANSQYGCNNKWLSSLDSNWIQAEAGWNWRLLLLCVLHTLWRLSIFQYALDNDCIPDGLRVCVIGSFHIWFLCSHWKWKCSKAFIEYIGRKFFAHIRSRLFDFFNDQKGEFNAMRQANTRGLKRKNGMNQIVKAFSESDEFFSYWTSHNQKLHLCIFDFWHLNISIFFSDRESNGKCKSMADDKNTISTYSNFSMVDYVCYTKKGRSERGLYVCVVFVV